MTPGSHVCRVNAAAVMQPNNSVQAKLFSQLIGTAPGKKN